MAPFEMEHVRRHALAAMSPKHYGHFQPTPQRYPAYSAGIVPFRWMMRGNMEEYRGLFELDVDESRERPASKRPSEIPERVRRRKRGEDPPRRKPNPARSRERGPRLARGEVRRTCRSRRAVDVAELRARLRHVRVGVPASAAEERRRDAEVAEAHSLVSHAGPGTVAGRPRVVGSGPVRVVAEPSASSSYPSSLRITPSSKSSSAVMLFKFLLAQLIGCKYRRNYSVSQNFL